MNRKRPAALEAAIQRLAQQNAELHVATSITDEDADPHITDDVMVGWWAEQLAENYEQHAFNEAFENLTPRRRNTLMIAIATNNPVALHMMREELIAHVAHFVAVEADAEQDSYSEIEPAEEAWDEPVRGNDELRSSLIAWLK